MKGLLNGRLPYLLIVVAFLAIAVFGPLSMAAMQHHEMNGMGSCPFMIGEAGLCQMSVFDHIASWQAIFSVPLVTSFNMALTLLFGLLSWIWIRHVFDSSGVLQRRPCFVRAKRVFALSPATLLLGNSLNPRAP